jgi:hypothetical protein
MNTGMDRRSAPPREALEGVVFTGSGLALGAPE